MSILRQIGEPLVCGTRFPAPREVGRYLYKNRTFGEAVMIMFPAPREVTSPSLSLGCDSLMFLNTANLAIFLQKYEI